MVFSEIAPANIKISSAAVRATMQVCFFTCYPCLIQGFLAVKRVFVKVS